MASAASAVVTACVFAALFAGHQIGDHVVASDTVMQAKAIPSNDRLAAGANPWTGWAACAYHVATYTATQAVAILLVSLAAPLRLAGVLAALVVSASTHAVIDRRWPVTLVIHAKKCTDWSNGPYLLDQALHYGALLAAAVLAAAVTSVPALAATTTAAAALVAVALALERWWARTAPQRTGDPNRL